jgi:hypothetical protein
MAVGTERGALVPNPFRGGGGAGSKIAHNSPQVLGWWIKASDCKRQPGQAVVLFAPSSEKVRVLAKVLHIGPKENKLLVEKMRPRGQSSFNSGIVDSHADANRPLNGFSSCHAASIWQNAEPSLHGRGRTGWGTEEAAYFGASTVG